MEIDKLKKYIICPQCSEENFNILMELSYIKLVDGNPIYWCSNCDLVLIPRNKKEVLK